MVSEIHTNLLRNVRDILRYERAVVLFHFYS